eukprot:COSAG06_NODE_20790_length_781_cov_0.756598_1_plen_219_part_01
MFNSSASVYEQVTGFRGSESFLAWGASEVAKWLEEQVRVPDAAKIILERGITGAQLAGLSQEQLKNVYNMKSGLLRKKVLMAVGKITLEAPSANLGSSSGGSPRSPQPSRDPPARRPLFPALQAEHDHPANESLQEGSNAGIGYPTHNIRPAPRDATLTVPAALGQAPQWEPVEPVPTDGHVLTQVWNPLWSAKEKETVKAAGQWEEVQALAENRWGVT